MMKRISVIFLLILVTAPFAQAAEEFIARDIRVEGIQRISPGTIFNYLPIKIGDKVTVKGTQEALRALYKTGFFKDVRLDRQDDVLVVTVVERPSISGIRIIGTNEFSEDDLKKGLKEVGLAEGRVFNRSLLDRVEQEMRQQYFSRGFYSVILRPTVTPLERNRVDITIDVSEGETARIREIKIIGNKVFNDKELLKLFSLGPRPWWAFFSSRDQYSKQKLSGDLERLRSFYQDRGYLDFGIDSTQVMITTDQQEIYVTVSLSEGSKYTVTSAQLAGKFVVPEAELRTLVTILPGDVFSRKQVTEVTRRISDRLADEGYAFANVNAVPEVNKEKSEVAFTFFVDPGKRIYVRRVNYAGNTATRDDVLRREMRQWEGATYSASKIQRSRARLQRLGFFEDVSVETPAVPGVPDQVDMNIKVKERSTGSLLVGVGYSDTDGFLINASVSQQNLLGSGKDLSVRLDNSSASTSASISYSNPYWTKDGVSRGFNLFSNSVDAEVTDTGDYTTETRGVGVFFGIPLSEDHRLHVGGDVERIKLQTGPTSAQVAQDFVAEHGPSNDLVKFTLGWSKDTLDSPVFPSSGGMQKLSGELSVPGSDIEYYRLTYVAAEYLPVTARTSFKLRGEIGYGDGYGDTSTLPFYKNFFAGGSGTVRGYESRSLGPRDTLTGDSIGGDRRVLVNGEFLFPLPGMSAEDKSTRLALFIDGGMAYGAGQDLDLGELRYASGLAFNWLSPVGPLSFSYAVPLNDKPGDEIENFQFTLGVPLR